MEELFRRQHIPFEHQKVYELGFGTGDLLLRFDTSCKIHGCEASAEAVSAIEAEPGIERYLEFRFEKNQDNGDPVFFADDYDLVIASHVIEHVPDDRRTLKLLAEHTKENGRGLFFLPLERPFNQNVNHVRTYTKAGFLNLLHQTGWQEIEVVENFRFDSGLEDLITFLSRKNRNHSATMVESTKNILFSLVPSFLFGLIDHPLSIIKIFPRQLMILAKREPIGGRF
jgi:SAM-dependent methyltransferase